MRRFRVSLAFLLASCGGAAAPSTELPSSSGGLSASDPDVARASREAVAEIRQIYAPLFGDDARVYAGELEASDERADVDVEEHRVVSGVVGGWLEQGIVADMQTLELVEPGGEDMVELWQRESVPGATGLMVHDAWSWGGYPDPWCADCATPFARAPDTIRVDFEARSGTVHTRARGQLHRAAWPALGAAGLEACLARLNGAGEHPAERDGARVRIAVHGAIDAGPVTAAVAAHAQCSRTRTYTGAVVLDPSAGTITGVIETLTPAQTRCCAVQGPAAACSPAAPADCVLVD